MSDQNSKSAASGSPKGKAVVTGASAGIGKLFAERLAERGYDLILVARRGDLLKTLSLSLNKKYGVKVETIAADLGNLLQLAQVAESIGSDPKVTLLLNNAGTSTLGLVGNAKNEEIAAMVNVNIVALTHLSIAVLAGFKERNDGTIINVGSVLGFHSLPISSIYSGTKGYVLNFTRGLQGEVEGTNVRIHLAAPAAIATDIWEISGVPLSNLDPGTVMAPENAVDAILAGFDLGESVILPSVEDPKLFPAYDAARLGILGGAQSSTPASRYKVTR